MCHFFKVHAMTMECTRTDFRVVLKNRDNSLYDSVVLWLAKRCANVGTHRLCEGTFITANKGTRFKKQRSLLQKIKKLAVFHKNCYSFVLLVQKGV